MTQRKREVNYLDLIKVIACFMVVLQHGNSCYFEVENDTGYWFSANVIASIVRFAVQVFFMVTGVNLLDFYDRYDVKTYFKKRFTSILIPYLFWSIASIMVDALILTSGKNKLTVRYIVNGFINGKIVPIYWFFIQLMLICICIPVLAAVEKEKKLKTYQYIVAFTFVFNILIPFLLMPVNDVINYNLQLPVISGYLFFAVAGYVFAKTDFTRIQRVFIYIFGIIGFLIQGIGTYCLTMKKGELDTTFGDNVGLPLVLYSLAMFLFLKQVGPAVLKNKYIKKVVGTISKYTYSIYLVHYFLIRVINITFRNVHYSLIYRLTAPFAIIGIIVVAVYVARKIPFVAKILP